VTADDSEREEGYPLREGEITFGRIGTNYSFDDALSLLSRSYARVSHRREDFFLSDLASGNRDVGDWFGIKLRFHLGPLVGRRTSVSDNAVSA
jgi:hypothetical protein